MKLLFISYINRSGSTFLANEFSKYSSILACPEAEVLVNYFIRRNEPFYCKPDKLRSLLSEIITRDPKLKYWNLKISDFSDLDKYQNNFEIFLDILRKYRDQVKPESSTILFKADTIAYYYNQIPDESYEKNDITFISIIRDGRASYASQRETIGARKQKPMNRNPVKVAKLWKNWITFFANHEKDPRFIIIRYEELIMNFQTQFDHLLSNLKLQDEIGKKMNKGDLCERIPPNQRSMHKNILKPPLQGNIGKWRYLLPSSHIAIFEKIAREELIQTNYDLMNPLSNRAWTYILYIYFWFIHIYHSSILKKWIRKTGKFLLFRAKRMFNINWFTISN